MKLKHLETLKKVCARVANTRPNPTFEQVETIILTVRQTLDALDKEHSMNAPKRDCDGLPVKLTAHEANQYWWAHADYLGNVRQDNARARRHAWKEICKQFPRLAGKEGLLHA